nr:intracellular serine protease {peptide VI} [Bacillus amyloliquefaciens, Peptide Partial, 16 aa] [Bacillus amyloliquefaciens]
AQLVRRTLPLDIAKTL